MKVLLIGLGRWGEKHLRVLSELGVDLWVADLSEERRALAVRAGIEPGRIVADFRDALSEVEAVDLVTPADTHRALAAECLQAGKDCFVEKPLALTAAEGLAIVESQRVTGRIVQVGHIFRFHAVTDALREWLAGGELGAIRYGTGRFAGFKRPRTDVGVTMTDALHFFDLFAYLLRQPPTAVTATQRDFLGRGLDDCSFSTVEYAEVPVFIEAGYFAPGTFRDCVIVGERATAAADFGASEVRVHSNQHVFTATGWQAEEAGIKTLKVSGPEPLRRELELFLDAVARREPPPVDAEAGLVALYTAEAARLSSAQQRRVTLSELE
ncbi:MAG TPA: Gfo/Idh/MocA family oxidoreductase [Candidatus Methylomirabilis sp.]|nr:Gfo/Idh/MocA family oxidoreductase [Candidatus Methylomirabilis sp.]